jgi:hypothetical protein
LIAGPRSNFSMLLYSSLWSDFSVSFFKITLRDGAMTSPRSWAAAGGVQMRGLRWLYTTRRFGSADDAAMDAYRSACTLANLCGREVLGRHLHSPPPAALT